MKTMHVSTVYLTELIPRASLAFFLVNFIFIIARANLNRIAQFSMLIKHIASFQPLLHLIASVCLPPIAYSVLNIDICKPEAKQNELTP